MMTARTLVHIASTHEDRQARGTARFLDDAIAELKRVYRAESATKAVLRLKLVAEDPVVPQ